MRASFISFDYPELTSGLFYFSQARATLSVVCPNLVRQRLNDLVESMSAISNMSGSECVLLFKELTSYKMYALNISIMLNTTPIKH